MTTILDALDDPELFGGALRDATTWVRWRTFLAALFGLPMTEAEADLYRTCTGRTTSAAAIAETWLVCGRRAGKSFVLALVAVFLACFKSYAEFLGPGERATVMVIATDRRQARVITRYVRGLVFGAPMLKAMVERETAESLNLSNGVTIEVQTASFRTTRGYTIAAALCDELAFWPTDDASEPDYAVLDAVRPGMGTIPGAMLLCASSPYARRGALWDAFRRYHGRDDAPVLVWKAPTALMNPTFPQAMIDAAYERDPVAAAAEYGAEFRSDLEAFVSREAIEACVSGGVRERAPVAGTRYAAFTDPSGGSADSMTLAIAHRQREGSADVAVLDAVREVKPPFSPESTVQAFCELLRTYGVTRVVGDRYGGEWPRERFRKWGVEYVIASRPKSQLYTSLLPAVNSRRVDLLDNPRLVAQLVGLERRTGRTGDVIDHAPAAHDDVCNAAAGALTLALDQSAAVVCVEPVIVTQPFVPFGSFGSFGGDAGTRNPAWGLPRDGRDGWDQFG